MKTIRYTVLLLATLMTLGACASHQGYYAQENFAPQGVASDKSFEQVVAECRYNTLTRNVIMDTYELEIPRYKACMQSHGYLYQGE